jgi:hypothetical protein
MNKDKKQGLKRALHQAEDGQNTSLYSIGAEEVLEYFEELKTVSPQLYEKLQRVDPDSLAVSIADYLGSAGLLELAQSAILEAIKNEDEVFSVADVQAMREAAEAMEQIHE